MEDKKPAKTRSCRIGAETAPSAPLFKGKGSVMNLLRDEDGKQEGSNAKPTVGAAVTLQPPVNIRECIKLKDWSPHHASCITTRKNCIVGLGFMSDDDLNGDGAIDENEATAAQAATLLTGAPYVKSKVDEVLDPLTMFGFSNEIMDWVEDFLDAGTAYLEVARKGEEIRYVGALPADSVRLMKKGTEIYFKVNEAGGTTKYFSRFGIENKAWLFSDGPYTGSTTMKPDDISEIIMLSKPTNRCRYYGYPDWIAAAIDIDLLKKAKQYKADFYNNRGVLDFIIVVTGTNVDDKEWKTIVDKISQTSCDGEQFKNMALNFASENVKVEVIKLAADMATEEQFAKDNEVFSQNIVSAHGVPPTLANILIPGKLGATNEFVNAISSFQLLRIGPDQRIVQKTLANTLGNPELNGGLDLKEDDFRLRTVTSQLNLQAFDTMSRMREEATTSGDRDLEDGVKD